MAFHVLTGIISMEACYSHILCKYSVKLNIQGKEGVKVHVKLTFLCNFDHFGENILFNVLMSCFISVFPLPSNKTNKILFCFP